MHQVNEWMKLFSQCETFVLRLWLSFTQFCLNNKQNENRCKSIVLQNWYALLGMTSFWCENCTVFVHTFVYTFVRVLNCKSWHIYMHIFFGNVATPTENSVKRCLTLINYSWCWKLLTITLHLNVKRDDHSIWRKLHLVLSQTDRNPWKLVIFFHN